MSHTIYVPLTRIFYYNILKEANECENYFKSLKDFYLDVKKILYNNDHYLKLDCEKDGCVYITFEGKKLKANNKLEAPNKFKEEYSNYSPRHRAKKFKYTILFSNEYIDNLVTYFDRQIMLADLNEKMDFGFNHKKVTQFNP